MFLFLRATPTIYYHCYENSCKGTYGRLVKDTIVKVAVKKTRTSQFIIGYAQMDSTGSYYLVPFVEDSEYQHMGTQRLKMKIIDNKAEKYETLDQDDVVNKLFFHPIEGKYLFSAKVVEYKNYEKRPKMIGESQDLYTRETYRRIYLQNYHSKDKGMMP